MYTSKAVSPAATSRDTKGDSMKGIETARDRHAGIATIIKKAEGDIQQQGDIRHTHAERQREREISHNKETGSSSKQQHSSERDSSREKGNQEIAKEIINR